MLFDNRFLKQVETSLRRGIKDNLINISKILEEEYKKNPYIKDAKVSVQNEDFLINIKLAFEPIDSEKQNLPMVFEHGGVIYRKDKNDKLELVTIEPGYYIKRAMSDA